MKKLPWKILVKYALSGAFNTFIGSAIMFFMYNVLDAGYWLSTAVNYGVCSVASYFLNKYFTFRNKEKSLVQFARFSLNILICYFVSYGMAKPLVSIILQGKGENIRDNVSMLSGMGIFAILNFLGQRMFVFKESR